MRLDADLNACAVLRVERREVLGVGSYVVNNRRSSDTPERLNRRMLKLMLLKR